MDYDKAMKAEEQYLKKQKDNTHLKAETIHLENLVVAVTSKTDTR
jgi:hypothetical protein